MAAKAHFGVLDRCRQKIAYEVAYCISGGDVLHLLMKTLTVRLPEKLASDIAAESRRRGISKSNVVRERLERGKSSESKADPLADIRDLIGSVDNPDLPSDLSARTKHYLRAWGYGRKRPR